MRFDTLKDAGLFYVCAGLALASLVFGGLWNEHGRDKWPAVAALVVATALVVAVVRYRPRRR